MKTILPLALLFLLAAQDPDDDENAPPPEGVKIEMSLRVLNVGGLWTFELEGKTNLPAGTYLEASVFVLEEVEYQGRKMLDEERLIYGKEGYADHTVEGEAFRIRIYEFAKKPFSLLYRARLYYDPANQGDEVLEAVGEKKFSAFADYRLGTPEDFEDELAATVKELDGEFRLVADLLQELRGEFEVYRKKYVATAKFDEKSWGKWTEEFLGKVKVIRDRNNLRYDLWAVWYERQGKLRTDGFCESFHRLLKDCTDYFDENEEALERAQLRIQGFQMRLEEAREVVGVDSPFHPDVVQRLVREYEAVAIPLEKIAESGTAPQKWDGEKKRITNQGRKALVRQVQHLPLRGYARIETLLHRLEDLIDGCDKVFSGKGEGVDLKRLVERHHAALV
ncbi:MAG: hypothetical protein ACYTAF_00005, partial [Planctomycetota bacterium]